MVHAEPEVLPRQRSSPSAWPTARTLPLEALRAAAPEFAIVVHTDQDDMKPAVTARRCPDFMVHARISDRQLLRSVLFAVLQTSPARTLE